MALQLEKTFNLNMEILLRMQTWHDARKMRMQSGKIKVCLYGPTNM